MDDIERKEYTKLLDIDFKWLTEYLTEMVVENDHEFAQAIDLQDRDWVSSIIERHIY